MRQRRALLVGLVDFILDLKGLQERSVTGVKDGGSILD